MSLHFTRRRIVIVLLAIAAVGGTIMYMRSGKDVAGTRYVTGTVERGTLVVSVSGSGSVEVSDQTDVKPSVSGDVVTVHVAKDDEVTKGQLLVSLNARDAVRAVSDAELALENAQQDLEDLRAGADAQALLSAQNALAQAERDRDKAKKTYDNIEKDTDDAIVELYDGGYSDVSSGFLKLSDYMADLQDVMGSNGNDENVSSYKLILGADSTLISTFTTDYDAADAAYSDTFDEFRGVYRSDPQDEIYALVEHTLAATEEVAQALESVRHMYDAVSVTSYDQYGIAKTIDAMRPKVESDLTAAFSLTSTLQKRLDDIDAAVEGRPDDIADAKIAYDSAVEKAEDKRIALEDLQAGADPLDIKSQENTVAQRAASLADAKDALADHYIRAPFAGVIADVGVERGDSVSSGTVLVSLLSRQQIAQLSLNEVDIAKVAMGQSATLTFDAVPDLVLTGKVTDIASTASSSQGVVSYDVTITFDTANEQIKPGMTVTAAIVSDVRQNVLMVPSSAVKYRGSQAYVETLSPDAATDGSVTPDQKDVSVGVSNDTMTEIVSGLNEGDTIVRQTVTAGTAAATATTGTNRTPSLFPTSGQGGNNRVFMTGGSFGGR